MVTIPTEPNPEDEPVVPESAVTPQGISYRDVVAGIARPVSMLNGSMQLDGYERDGFLQASRGLTDFFGASPRAPLELTSMTGYGATVGYGMTAPGHYRYPFKVHAVTEAQPNTFGIPFSGLARVHIGFCGIPRSRTAFIMRWSDCRMDVDWLGFAKYGIETARLDRLWAFMDGSNFYVEVVPRTTVRLMRNQKGKLPVVHDRAMLTLYNSLE